MIKRLKVLRIVHIVSLILSALLVVWCIFCLLFDVSPAIEWVILLFMEATAGIPGSIYALQDIRKAEEKQSNVLESNDKII